MQVYKCLRCGSKYDFVNKGDHHCEVCGANLTFWGEETSPWGEFEKKDA